MYAGVPMSAPDSVMPASIVASRASPKSITIGTGRPSSLRSIITLAGFRSRCTMPSLCASWMASATSRRTAIFSSSVIDLAARCSGSPSTNCSAM